MSELRARCAAISAITRLRNHPPRVTAEKLETCALWDELGLRLPRVPALNEDDEDDEDDEDAAQRVTEHGDDDESGAGYRVDIHAWEKGWGECDVEGVVC